MCVMQMSHTLWCLGRINFCLIDCLCTKIFLAEAEVEGLTESKKMLQDRSIAVWDMTSQTEITLRRVLVGHRAAVNVVDFDEKYIVSASGDRTIKVWNTSTCEFVRTLNGHKRGIACLQYRDRLVVSGSSDNTIRSLNNILLSYNNKRNKSAPQSNVILYVLYKL